MIQLPKKIRVLSDDTELELVEEAFFEKKKTSDRLGRYRYVKAEVLLGQIIILSLDQINYLHGCKSLEIIPSVPTQQ